MKLLLIFAMIGGFFFTVGRCGLSRKPSPNSLVNRQAKEPTQIALEEGSPETRSFSLDYDDRHYQIFPKANYAIEGLIVSQHRSDSLFDLAHARSGDTLNSRDICTIWGSVLNNGVYEKLKIWSGDWTCYFQYFDAETAKAFRGNELSNTHVIAKDPTVRAKLASLETGDEYRMTGKLADYELAGVGRRNTSLIRTDTGNGACEILFVESVEVLKSHNRFFKIVRDFGFWVALLAVLGLLITMIRAVFFRGSTLGIGVIAAFTTISLTSQTTEAKICNASKDFCGDYVGGSSSSSSSSSRGVKIRVNPAFVPVGRGLGAEFIYFDQQVDFAIVKGLGRVGAAISPSNSEETFFGPPGIERSDLLLERKRGKHKFPNQKITLATAFGLFDNKKSGFERLSLNLGVMGKYNKRTAAITPGAGVSGVVGPLSFGYSQYKDETEIDNSTDPLDGTSLIRYNVETFSAGAYIGILAFDYSILRVLEAQGASISVITATLIWENAIFTGAIRNDTLTRASYNYEKDVVEFLEHKTEYFGGIQYAIAEPLMLGVFYNYYLMRDISFGATVFF